MKTPHLFEFMDLDWVPGSLRQTLREILECGNSDPFRPYYRRVAEAALQTALDGGFQNIVELGAGTAPITRHMAQDPRSEGLRLVCCDLHPDKVAYEALEGQYPGKVSALTESVDFSQPRDWAPKTILLLSATFHHIPPDLRTKVIHSLTTSADRVLIFEPLRKTVGSFLFVFPSLFPALLLPIWFFRRPGKGRRFLWCWLVPVAPLMFWWDGLVSCWRQWTDLQWWQQLKGLVRRESVPPSVKSEMFTQAVAW